MPNNVKITSSHRVLTYINSIVMAFIISLLMFPVHEWFERKMPKHKNSASLLTCVVLTFIIVIPLLFVFAAIVQQGSVFSSPKKSGNLLPLLVQTLSRSVRKFWVMQQTS